MKDDGGHATASATQPSLADICLVPQLYGARRFGGGPRRRTPRCSRIEAACAALPAFQAAHPDRQPDAAPA